MSFRQPLTDNSCRATPARLFRRKKLLASWRWPLRVRRWRFSCRCRDVSPIALPRQRQQFRARQVARTAPYAASLSLHTRERIPLARREIHRALSRLACAIAFLLRSKGVSGVYRVDVAVEQKMQDEGEGHTSSIECVAQQSATYSGSNAVTHLFRLRATVKSGRSPVPQDNP